MPDYCGLYTSGNTSKERKEWGTAGGVGPWPRAVLPIGKLSSCLGCTTTLGHSRVGSVCKYLLLSRMKNTLELTLGLASR